MLLDPPDDLTAAALKRLAQRDPDFQRVLAWLEGALAARDAANRTMIDGVLLRMGQGSAVTLAEFIGLAKGASKGALRDTVRPVTAAQRDRTP